jgi:hypothetical protein
MVRSATEDYPDELRLKAGAGMMPPNIRTETFTETANIVYAVAPDHLYETVLAAVNQATASIYYEGYTFKNAHLADAIVARMTAIPTMTVTILLEGEPGRRNRFHLDHIAHAPTDDRCDRQQGRGVGCNASRGFIAPRRLG